MISDSSACKNAGAVIVASGLGVQARIFQIVVSMVELSLRALLALSAFVFACLCCGEKIVGLFSFRKSTASRATPVKQYTSLQPAQASRKD